MSVDISLVSPSIVLENIKKVHLVDSIIALHIIEILGKPFYQLPCIADVHRGGTKQHNLQTINLLADAATGQLRGPLTKKEAVGIASRRFNGTPGVKSVEYLTRAGRHHEYRENPLPAYAVNFEHPTAPTVYVASELGTVQKFRNKKWLLFDFLWMLHTMDYQGRDNFGNMLLRVFSIFG